MQQMTQAVKNNREAERLKMESKQHEDMIEMQRQNEQLKNSSMKQQIRQNKEEAIE